jgi:hypothetical protein
MKTRNGAIVALLVLATCSEDGQAPSTSSSTESPADIESSRLALGKIPPSESAVWQKVGSSSTPDPRYLQAAAFDTTRKVVVMFGGTNMAANGGTATPNQDTWEWDTTTGKWTNRTGTTGNPDARSGAAMVYDSKRAKIVLFGGRAGSGLNYEDTWEWDPATGQWTEVTAAGSRPTGRSQHRMVYETSTGKILLFGGGRSDSNSYDGTGIVAAMSDTWEMDPATHVWTAVTGAGPSARHDFGMVWDGTRNKAVLFGGMQVDISGVAGIPKQDTWEWDPTNLAWTERTMAGPKPGPRFGHAMAFDGSRNKVVVVGGFDIASGGSLADVWDWDPTTGVWTQRMTGAESPMPSPRQYASLVSDDARARLELIAGATTVDPYGKGGTGGIIIYPPGMYGTTGSREVWELDPAKPAFTDRTAPLDVPSPRAGHCMAYNPSTGLTYVYGGSDPMTGQLLDDLWAWDGKTWAEIASDVRPPGRSDSAMAFDPSRKSLILYGGSSTMGEGSDTWEWTPGKGWAQLFPKTSPDTLFGHGMVTDTTRNKILLFGGMSYMWRDPYKDPMRNDIWEWDGTAMTWTNRTPIASSGMPMGREYPLMAYDSGQKKMFVYDGANYGSNMTVYWEWDPESAGWAMHDSSDYSQSGYASLAAYDSIRRREVILAQSYSSGGPYGTDTTWELDANSETWYMRTISSPPSRYSAGMVFDTIRGVVVMFGGYLMNSGYSSNDTWEYRVTGLGNGEGCTAASASTCSSSFCVDGVCCEASACTGPCKSCNVRGSEGSCVAAKAGTEVPGSCSNGQACDGKGNCMSANGQPCTSASTCASGSCADGVCCDTACTGTCMACNQSGRTGKCSPYAAGSDPQKECGSGTSVCGATCDGVRGCAYPQSNVTCGKCLGCDGMGTCSVYDWYCGSYAGTGGYVYPTGGTGGYVYPTGGSGGYVNPTGGSGGRYLTGGSGGYIYPAGGAPYGGVGTGGRIPLGGTGPYLTGGMGGYTTARGGTAGSIYPTGGFAGYTTARGGTAGSIYPTGGFAGYTTARGGSGGYGFGGTPPAGFGGTTIVGFGGTVGTGGLVGAGGAIAGVGGSGGKQDAGSPVVDGGKHDSQFAIDAITDARLHRSGCSCELGQAQGSSLAVPLLVPAVGLLLVRIRRRRR